MSVVAAVGPAAAASYGQPLCGGGARKRKGVGVVQDQEAGPPAGSVRGGDDAGLFVLETVEEEADADADAERSSIGAASEDDDEDGEVDSGGTSSAAATGTKGAGAALARMDMGALDDALPIKRGLSNFFSGKSRSFANLQDAASAVSSARGLAKPENPFNKRRRVLRCCATRWRAASASLAAPPPTTAGDDDDDVGGAGRSGG